MIPDVRNSQCIDVFEVASPDSAQTSSTGDPGVSAVTEDAPEVLPHGLVVDEFFALLTDEGQNSSNAWRIHEHLQHGLDNLIRTVDGVLIRAKIDSQLAEVSR